MTQRELPSGTVTFLFTDVEGSTRLLHELGGGYADLLAQHRVALREAFAKHAGVEVDTQGDAFFVAFRRAADALAAAADAQLALEGTAIRVRMGVHTGEPIVTDEGYVGIDVHRAARIAAAAHGGQVVLSETTRALLDSGTPVRELGEHRLKDMTGAERLYQLGDREFPALRTLDATNLPVASSPLLGRERELGEITALLSDGTRLVTVTGPGGTGKTRLALQVAADLVGTPADGVFWVPLIGLADAELVPSEVAKAIGAPDDLDGFLRDRKLLLLLDNFEHLIDAAPAVSKLLAGSSGLRILVTSRAPLHVSGEREYPLEPLQAQDAVTLFAERARAVGRLLAPDETIEAICRRLDRLPLAIELAAARTKLLSPERLLERLESVLPILTSGSRDVPERQRTLRATIEWSYDLLDGPSKSLFARLSVFAGSFSVEAAETICSADLDGLGALVDASLLKPTGDDRFLMLVTIREYALERLAGSAQATNVREAHASFFSTVAEQAYEARIEAEGEWSDQLEVDHDDLRSALDFLLANDPDRSLELAGALGWFWLSHGHLTEGRGRLTRALAASSASGPARARALTAAGALEARLGNAEGGRAQIDEGIALWRSLGDLGELADALDALGWLLVYDGGDGPGALDAFEQSLELRRQVGDEPGALHALVGVCQALVALGNTMRAESLSHELLAMPGAGLRTEHFALHFLADCALLRDDYEEAQRRYRESLRAARSLGDVLETSFEVQGVAMSVAALGDPRRALVLAGAVEALWQSLGTWVSVAFWDALLERHIGSARQQLGASADAAWSDGRAMAFDDAVQLALTP